MENLEIIRTEDEGNYTEDFMLGKIAEIEQDIKNKKGNIDVAKNELCSWIDELERIQKIKLNKMENKDAKANRINSYSIFSNGKKTDWIEGENLTYEQLLFHAYPKLKGLSPIPVFSAVYEYPEHIDKRGKSLLVGGSVKLENGMIFEIYNTSNG